MYKFLLALSCFVLFSFVQAQTQVPAEDISNYVSVAIPTELRSNLNGSTSVCFKQSTSVAITFNQPTTISTKSQSKLTGDLIAVSALDGSSYELPQETTFNVTSAQINGDIYVVVDESGIKFIGLSKSLIGGIGDTSVLNPILNGDLVGGGQGSACFAEANAMNCTIVQCVPCCYAVKAAKKAFCVALSAKDGIESLAE
jgi:hypothetical protein